MKERVIVVLGMHRSGTSIVSAALECLGVSFGDHLLGPREDNPKGFWEDEDFVELNERLYELGGSFSSALGFDAESARRSPDYPQLHERMKSLLRTRLDRQSVFGLKDPRMPRLMALWGSVLDEMGVDVAFVMPLRNPLSVAASLANRDDFPTIKSLLLWYEHMFRGLSHAAERRMLVVDYDAFMDQPREALLRVARELALAFDAERFSRFTQETLCGELRHSRFSDADLHQHKDSFPALESLHALLKRMAQEQGPADEEVLDREMQRIDLEFAQIWPVLRRCGLLDIELWGGAQQLEELRGWTDSLKATIQAGERERQLEQLRQREHLQELNTSFAARESELVAWISTLECTIQAAEEERRGSLDWFEEQRQVLEKLAASREQSIRQLDEQLSSSRRMLQQLLGSRSWRLTRPLRWCGRLLSRV